MTRIKGKVAVVTGGGSGIGAGENGGGIFGHGSGGIGPLRAV